MSQHTPGPWKAHPIEMNYGLPYAPVSAKTLLAKVYSEAFGDYAQSEANARLIAAAPDLLAAANAAIVLLITHGLDAGQAGASLEIAIAKATGEPA